MLVSQVELVLCIKWLKESPKPWFRGVSKCGGAHYVHLKNPKFCIYTIILILFSEMLRACLQEESVHILFFEMCSKKDVNIFGDSGGDKIRRCSLVSYTKKFSILYFAANSDLFSAMFRT